MLKIDDNLLQQIGLGSLPAEDKRGLLTHIYETLEMRVGMRLADQMTNEQLDEFETYFEAKDDAGAFKWLETNFPNYKDIVNEEFEKLKTEVQQAAPQILAAARANPAPAAPAPQAAPLPPAGYQPPAYPQQQPYAPPLQATPAPGYALQAAPAPAQPYAAPPAQPYTPPAPQAQPYQPLPSQPMPPSQPATQPWNPAPAPIQDQAQPLAPQ